MDQFPPNSQKARVPDEPKKIERITSAEAERRKPSLGRRFRNIFISGDAKTTVQYATEHVVVPAIRDLVMDALHSTIDSYFGGNTRPRRGGSLNSYGGVGHVNYQRMSSPQQSTPVHRVRQLSREARARQQFDEIVIPSRQEAEDVIDHMFDILSKYGSVSVADLYGLTGVRSSHTDYKWGWKSLPGARASRLRNGGFLLDLPDPEPLD